MPRRHIVNEADTGIVRFGRREFFMEVFDYRPGDHCTFLAPSGGGKTQIAFEALGATANPDLKATIFVMKPKDTTVVRFANAFHYETIRDWPPSTVKLRQRLFGSKRSPGYVLWPKESADPEADDKRHAEIFRRCMRDMYRSAAKHPNIMFADETYSLENEYGLKEDLRRAWTKGRSLGNGLWAASQRPAYISQWAYQAQHLFIGRDDDERAQKRYEEIGGGFNPDVVRALLKGLERFEFLYINRDERSMCIIEAS